MRTKAASLRKDIDEKCIYEHYNNRNKCGNQCDTASNLDIMGMSSLLTQPVRCHTTILTTTLCWGGYMSSSMSGKRVVIVVVAIVGRRATVLGTIALRGIVL